MNRALSVETTNRGRRLALGHPARLVTLAFAITIVIGTVLLMLPVASESGTAAPPVVALFTSTSAVCVTGLIVVDTPAYWSGFGEAVIMVLVQIGGFGIMTLGSVLALVVFRRLGLRHRLAAQAETNALDLGDVRRVLRGVAIVTVVVELTAAVILTTRFAVTYDEPFGRAVWLGVFHAITSFNNAGFALFSDNLIAFVGDAWINLTVAIAIVIGGLGFPVIVELVAPSQRARRAISLHTRLTLWATLVLIVVGMLAVLGFEWSNSATLGRLGMWEKVLAGFFQSVNARTAGFNTIITGDMRESTLLVTDVLMFIGAGAASTAGGIKVTTAALLGFAAWAEARGSPDVNVFARRVPAAAQRQASVIAILAIGAIVTGTIFLSALGEFELGDVLFEAISAFGTVGLSTGITAALGEAGHLALVALMFLGRLGPLTLGTALVLGEQRRLYRLPEERPIIG